jgi:hypothetical protein
VSSKRRVIASSRLWAKSLLRRQTLMSARISSSVVGSTGHVGDFRKGELPHRRLINLAFVLKPAEERLKAREKGLWAVAGFRVFSKLSTNPLQSLGAVSATLVDRPLACSHSATRSIAVPRRQSC